MPQSLDVLESQRAELLRQIVQLGDLRRGSITSITARCGKPNCHCHQPNHPGHGPNFRLTYKVRGKTLSETFPSPPARRQAERQIAEFRKFQQLSRAFLEVNEKICRQRPLTPEREGAEQEKNRASHSAGSRARGEAALLLPHARFNPFRKHGKNKIQATVSDFLTVGSS